MAERLGIRQLKPDVAEALARDVQYRIHEIIQVSLLAIYQSILYLA